MYQNVIIKTPIRNPVTRTTVLVAIAESAKKMLNEAKQSPIKITFYGSKNR